MFSDGFCWYVFLHRTSKVLLVRAALHCAGGFFALGRTWTKMGLGMGLRGVLDVYILCIVIDISCNLNVIYIYMAYIIYNINVISYHTIS